MPMHAVITPRLLPVVPAQAGDWHHHTAWSQQTCRRVRETSSQSIGHVRAGGEHLDSYLDPQRELLDYGGRELHLDTQFLGEFPLLKVHEDRWLQPHDSFLAHDRVVPDH